MVNVTAYGQRTLPDPDQRGFTFSSFGRQELHAYHLGHRWVPPIGGVPPLVRDVHRYGTEVRNDNPIDCSSSVLCTRWWRMGIFSLAQIAPPGHFEAGPSWYQVNLEGIQAALGMNEQVS